MSSFGTFRPAPVGGGESSDVAGDDSSYADARYAELDTFFVILALFV